MNKFVNYTIADRIAIITEDGDVFHIYELLSKHYGESIELLKSEFDIELDKFRAIITITSDPSHICELVEYLHSYNVNLQSVTMRSISINLYEFIRKIY